MKNKIITIEKVGLFFAVLLLIVSLAFALEMHTGQTQSYTATDGEDADIDGTPKSYTDNGDGTVTDDHTGLMWEKSDAGTMAWDSAIDYCNGRTTAGYSDWRLPNIYELDTMADYSCSGSGDSGCYSDFENDAFSWSTTTSYYWSSTTRPDTTGYAYRLGMGSGYVNYGDKASSYYVRCVRDV